MANETKVFEGTPKALETNGGSIANNAVLLATTSYDRLTDGLNYPDAEFVLALTFSVAPVINSTVDLYANEQNIKGTNDETTATATYKPRYITSFVVTSITTIQHIKKSVRRVPELATFTLHNNATGQSVSAGWTLDIIPTTLGPV